MDVKNFAPSWFASVMGTGALALVSKAYSSKLSPRSCRGADNPEYGSLFCPPRSLVPQVD